jgi:hypothetical protein
MSLKPDVLLDLMKEHDAVRERGCESGFSVVPQAVRKPATVLLRYPDFLDSIVPVA